jgi:hypothetical protein
MMQKSRRPLAPRPKDKRGCFAVTSTASPVLARREAEVSPDHEHRNQDRPDRQESKKSCEGEAKRVRVRRQNNCSPTEDGSGTDAGQDVRREPYRLGESRITPSEESREQQSEDNRKEENERQRPHFAPLTLRRLRGRVAESRAVGPSVGRFERWTGGSDRHVQEGSVPGHPRSARIDLACATITRSSRRF